MEALGVEPSHHLGTERSGGASALAANFISIQKSCPRGAGARETTTTSPAFEKPSLREAQPSSKRTLRQQPEANIQANAVLSVRCFQVR